MHEVQIVQGVVIGEYETVTISIARLNACDSSVTLEYFLFKKKLQFNIQEEWQLKHEN